MKKTTVVAIVLILSIILVPVICLAEKPPAAKVSTAKFFHDDMKILGYQFNEPPDPEKFFQVITYKRNAYYRWGAACTIRAWNIGGLLAGILVEADRDFPDLFVYYPFKTALQYIAAVSAKDRRNAFDEIRAEGAQVWKAAYDRWEKRGIFHWRGDGVRVVALKSNEVVTTRFIRDVRDAYHVDELLSEKADSGVLLKRLNGLLENMLSDLRGIPNLKHWDKEGPEKLIVEIRSRELCR